jgi:hypothetical protein
MVVGEIITSVFAVVTVITHCAVFDTVLTVQLESIQVLVYYTTSSIAAQVVAWLWM